MILFFRINLAPATFRLIIAGRQIFVPNFVGRQLCTLISTSKLQVFYIASKPQEHGTSAKSLKYWNGLQCQTRGLFGQCRTGGLAVLKQALKPGVSNTCRVPSAGYCDSSVSYRPQEDDTGLTYIDDLGPEDELLLQAIVYQEVKALLDKHQIPYKKRKGHSTKFNKLYGSSLRSIVIQDVKVGKHIGAFKCPAFYMEMVRYLDNQVNNHSCGEIFTDTTVDTTAFRDDAIKNYYSKGVNLEQYGPKVVGAGLRRFLRELREPLLSVDQLKSFPPLSTLENINRLQVLNYLYIMMPKEHRDTLQPLCYLCQSELQACGSRNKSREGQAAHLQADVSYRHEKKDAGKQKFWAGENQLITRLYLDYHDLLRTVSPTLIKQIRHLYMTGKAAVKPRKRFPWSKKEKFDGEQAKPDTNVRNVKHTEIVVQAPHLEKKQDKVKVNEQTTALDVVAKFDNNKDRIQELSRKSRNKTLATREKTYSYLFEVGGNIGSRCIDPNAKVLEIFKINPDAGFVVQPGFGR